MLPPINQNNTMRIGLTISSLVLIWLLIAKFTGYDSLFSYQATTPWIKRYNSWIMLINTFLEEPDTSQNLLVEWKKYISYSLENLKSKKLLEQINWDIKQLSTMEIYNETKKCLESFITWVTLLNNIKQEFLVASNNITTIETTMKERIFTLPSSNTKQCLELYVSSLRTSKESLGLTYNNISTMEWLYSKSMSWYREKWWGLCPDIEEFIKSATILQNSLVEVVRTTELVQKKLDSFDIQEYNTLCKYWWIQWVEKIQKESWSTKNHLDSFVVNLKKTKNIRDYIKSIIPISWSWALVNINSIK